MEGDRERNLLRTVQRVKTFSQNSKVDQVGFTSDLTLKIGTALYVQLN